MPPEAEENGAHAQEANCSLQLQRKIRKRARMWIVASGHTVPSTKHGKEKKKVGFSLFGKKMNHSEIHILILISY